jgi:hypothetical protein
MNNRSDIVIGILPPIPQYPSESDVYMPTSQCPMRSDPRFIAERGARMMNAFGRLKPGVSVEQAQADLSTLAGQLERSYPEAYKRGYGYGITVAPLREDLTRRCAHHISGTAGRCRLRPTNRLPQGPLTKVSRSKVVTFRKARWHLFLISSW